jgi:hypothetical protein
MVRSPERATTGRNSNGPLGNGPSPNCVTGFYKQQAVGTACNAPRGKRSINHATTPRAH